MDDLENYRALELLHQSFCLRFRVWQLSVDFEEKEIVEGKEDVHKCLQGLRKVSLPFFL
jgi:hypothetical protein